MFVELLFLPSVYAPCPTCHGARYNAKTLEIKYRDKTIADVLGMTVDAAWEFFADEPPVLRALDVLREVGLGYLRLGQPATELSGGEAQRIKLATELQRDSARQHALHPRRAHHGTCIPPTSKSWSAQLDGLVESGNTVIVVEHDMRVVAASDYVIDIGPGAGEEGGRVVASGTPAEIARCIPGSRTAPYLARFLEFRCGAFRADENLRRSRCLKSGLNSFHRLASANPKRFSPARHQMPGCVRDSPVLATVAFMIAALLNAATMLASATSLPRGVSKTRVLNSACSERFHTLLAERRPISQVLMQSGRRAALHAVSHQPVAEGGNQMVGIPIRALAPYMTGLISSKAAEETSEATYGCTLVTVLSLKRVSRSRMVNGSCRLGDDPQRVRKRSLEIFKHPFLVIVLKCNLVIQELAQMSHPALRGLSPMSIQMDPGLKRFIPHLSKDRRAWKAIYFHGSFGWTRDEHAPAETTAGPATMSPDRSDNPAATLRCRR